MKPLMIDLCAGFGGQSEAFLRGGFDVIRVDNNPLLSEVPNMFIEDIYNIEPFNISGRDAQALTQTGSPPHKSHFSNSPCGAT